MTQIDDGSVDMILCDLPYGTTANKWDTIIPLDRLWDQYERIIKDNGAIVLTAAQPFTSVLVMSKPRWFRYDLVWEKTTPVGFLNANRQPLRKHESILVFSRKPTRYFPQFTEGKPYKARCKAPTTNYSYFKPIKTEDNKGKRYPTSVIRMGLDKVRGLHPTQKPVALFEYLIRTYTKDGDLVLDNCMGSGTTAIAALRSGRSFIGFEQDPLYYAKATARIESGKLT